MRLKKSLTLMILVGTGLLALTGCLEGSLFNQEVEISVISMTVTGTNQEKILIERDNISALSSYDVTATLQVANRVSVTITHYKVEYYKSDGSKVEYFLHKGKPATLVRQMAKNCYIEASEVTAEEPAEAKVRCTVVTSDLINYAKYTGETVLNARVTFIGEDRNGNAVEVMGSIGIEFYTGIT